MPKKIKVVDVEAHNDEPAVEVAVEPVVNEPEKQVEVASDEITQPLLTESAPPVKEKKPRAPRAKQEPVKEIIREIIKEVPVEVIKEVQVAPPVEEKPNQNIKTVELVECPDCHKKLTQRTLKYSHQAVCPVKNPQPPTTEAQPKKSKKPVEEVQQVEEEYMETNPVGGVKRTITRVMLKKNERYKHLVANAF